MSDVPLPSHPISRDCRRQRRAGWMKRYEWRGSESHPDRESDCFIIACRSRSPGTLPEYTSNSGRIAHLHVDVDSTATFWPHPDSVFLCYFVSDILPPFPDPEPAQPPLDSDQEFFRNFWSPPTNLYPYFLFPATTHGTAHGTFRTQRTEIGTSTSTITGMGTAANGTGFGSHDASLQETLYISLQFPELVVPVIPGESAFSTLHQYYLLLSRLAIYTVLWLYLSPFCSLASDRWTSFQLS